MEKLSIYERTVLANQYRILEKLYPDHIGYRVAREAVENGYESFYYGNNIHMETDTLSKEQTYEIIHILDMYRFLLSSFNLLKDKGDLNLKEVTFNGFGHNWESQIIAFIDWFCNRQTDKRFTEIDITKDSIDESLPRYRRILEKYNEIKPSGFCEGLSLDQIKQIVR